MECPNLLELLQLIGYRGLLYKIPSILEALPSLESLRCDFEDEDYKVGVVFGHRNLCDVFFEATRLFRAPKWLGTKWVLEEVMNVNLVMPELVIVVVNESEVRALEIITGNDVEVKYHLQVEVEGDE